MIGGYTLTRTTNPSTSHSDAAFCSRLLALWALFDGGERRAPALRFINPVLRGSCRWCSGALTQGMSLLALVALSLPLRVPGGRLRLRAVVQVLVWRGVRRPGRCQPSGRERVHA